MTADEIKALDGPQRKGGLISILNTMVYGMETDEVELRKEEIEDEEND